MYLRRYIQQVVFELYGEDPMILTFKKAAKNLSILIQNQSSTAHTVIQNNHKAKAFLGC